MTKTTKATAALVSSVTAQSFAPHSLQEVQGDIHPFIQSAQRFAEDIRKIAEDMNAEVTNAQSQDTTTESEVVTVKDEYM